MKLNWFAHTALVCVTIIALSLSAVTAQAAPSNVGPPVGPILDLGGLPIPGNGNGTTYQTYSVDFTGTVAITDITFAFREDPAFLSLDNVSLVDLTTVSPNLLTNGDFEGGTYTSNGNSLTPIGWTYANVYGASFGGIVQGITNGTNGWYDGAVQAYDAISQSVATPIGDLFRITFDLADNSGESTFSALSTNGDVTDTGGNGIDTLVYAQAGLPAPSNVPEPGTMLLMGLGVACAAFLRARAANA